VAIGASEREINRLAPERRGSGTPKGKVAFVFDK
jgi:hypothetical protein